MKRELLLMILFAAACADNRSSIEIGGRATPSDTTTCEFAAGGKTELQPGLLDLAPNAVWTPQYALVVYVTNNLADPALLNPASNSAPAAPTATKTWTANSAHIRVTSPSLVAGLEENNAVAPQPIRPGGGAGTQYVTAVSPDLAAKIADKVGGQLPQTIVVGITLEGITYDGAHLDSGEWSFPIQLCSGCLAPPPSCPTGQVLKQTNCFGAGQDSAPVCGTPTTQ